MFVCADEDRIALRSEWQHDDKKLPMAYFDFGYSAADIKQLCAAAEKQFDKPFSYADFGTRLEEATHGYVKRIQSLIASKDEATVNRIADMLDSMGFDAVTGYFDPKEDERSGEVDSLTGYYYVDI